MIEPGMVCVVTKDVRDALEGDIVLVDEWDGEWFLWTAHVAEFNGKETQLSVVGEYDPRLVCFVTEPFMEDDLEPLTPLELSRHREDKP